VGAGDTFNAGVLAGLDEAGALTKPALDGLDEETLRSALTLGAQAAAITVSRAGANGLDEETLRSALTLGAQAAAITVSRAGANPPKRGEL